MDTSELGRIALRRRLMALGISQAYASELSNGKRAPKLELAGRIFEKIGIPVEVWVAIGLDDLPTEERARRQAERLGAATWEVLVDEAIQERKSRGKEDRARGAA